MKLAISFLVGLLFALGLGLSGMTQPQKVIGFLDLFRAWNPALAFVMVGAIGLHAILYPLIVKRKSPVLEDHFHLPTATRLNFRLILGATIFGAGWGLGGFCPGPALVSLASGNIESFIFVGSMVIGMFIFHFAKPLLGNFLP